MNADRARFALLVALAVLVTGCLVGNGGDGEDGEDGDDSGTPPRGGGNGGDGDASGGDGGGEAVPDRVALESVVEGLDTPTFVTVEPGEAGRILVLEQPGRVRVIGNGAVTGTFLDIADRVKSGGEQGLLGLAFHPAWEENGQAFVHYSDVDGDTVVSRFTRGEDGALDAGTESVVLTVDQPFANHNGGMIAFAPDAVGDGGSYLYVALGDGGSGGDPGNHGQEPATLLGSILRVDVDGESDGKAYGIPADNPFADGGDGAPEVWAFGLRNPWRFSFDRETGDLWIADVGQNEVEEVNRDAAPLDAGRNYGWNTWEGERRYAVTPTRGDATFPVHAYAHEDTGGCSVTGGYAYRGSDVPGLQGAYVFADYCVGDVWALVQDGTAWSRRSLASADGSISSFGEDADGELLVVLHDGRILRVAAAEG